MISHEKKCLFIHIPKVAGTSLIAFLQDKGAEPRPPSMPDDPFDPPPPHLRAGDYLKYDLVSPEQFDAYFKFAFVRNPWDRLVSEYVYRLRPRKYDFKTWVFHRFPRPSWDDRYCHVIPQYDFLHDGDGRLLVDFVGRYENLQADFEEVCRRLDLPQASLPRDNVSKSILGRRRDQGWIDVVQALRSQLSLKRMRNTFPHYRDYYDEETKAFVADLHRKDIAAFGYDF